MTKKNVSLILIALMLVGGLALDAGAAKKKEIPGGQNQLKGVDEGKVGAMLFNGVTRVCVNNFKYYDVDPNDPNNKPGAGERFIAIEVLYKNGDHFTKSYGGPNCKVQLVDKDGQLFEKMRNVKKSDWRKYEGAARVLPAASLKACYLGVIDKEYVPVRMIIITDPGKPVFRINL